MDGRSLRLDQLLVARGLVQSRSRARDLVRQGQVCVDGATETKPARLLAPDAQIALAAEANAYVSRGALKLLAALEALDFSPLGRTALDIGASTGGFTEVLLERGASKVIAVDVGRDQLHPRLRAHPAISSFEAMDARKLTRVEVPEPVGCLVADVSFISLTLALPAALGLTAPGCWLVALVKPQFEAGREEIGKGGIVRTEAARQRALEKISNWLAAQPGWKIKGTIASPIAGGDGNVEFLIGARRDD